MPVLCGLRAALAKPRSASRRCWPCPQPQLPTGLALCGAPRRDLLHFPSVLLPFSKGRTTKTLYVGFALGSLRDHGLVVDTSFSHPPPSVLLWGEEKGEKLEGSVIGGLGSRSGRFPRGRGRLSKQGASACSCLVVLPQALLPPASNQWSGFISRKALR